MAYPVCLGAGGSSGRRLVLREPSPQDETVVTHELRELTLQPSQTSLPPLKERKNVLQLRLQQRRTREQLVEQGIMPPLKCPAAFHEQIRSLQRSRTENFLKHKIRSRPQRSELIRMHILQETHAEPSLQATQMKLKRARLAIDLNEKLAQRPGPMELVVKNILPVEPSVVTDGESSVDAKTTILDVYNFDDESSDSLSPEQPTSQESQSSSVPSPHTPMSNEAPALSPHTPMSNEAPALSPHTPMSNEAPALSLHTPRSKEAPAGPSKSPPSGSTIIQQCPPAFQSNTDLLNFSQISTNEHQNNFPMTKPQPITSVAPPKPGPMLVKQSQPKTPSDKNRSKKNKDLKPRVKKLKYHQYIPPDQKQEPNEAPMDSTYARLLQQQQQFLHLQILSQQQQHYNYQAILPAPLKSIEGQNSCPNLSSAVAVSPPSSTPVRSIRKPGVLPANLDEMKVAELKTELKLRGLPVSGTKIDLIERLKPCLQSPSSHASSAMEVTGSARAPQSESMSSSPPVSPASSDVSSLGTEESGMPGALCPHRGPLEEGPMETRTLEKDQRLHEKERQIEELMRKLEQEQRLVEALKMQLEVEKRGQPSPPAPALTQVKEEPMATSNCRVTHSPLGLPVDLKQEPTSAPEQVQYLIRTQQATPFLRQPQILVPGQRETQNAAAAMTDDKNTPLLVLQTSVTCAAPVLVQKTEASSTQQQRHASQTPPVPQTTVPMCSSSSSTSEFQFRAGAGAGPAEKPQCFLNTSPGRRSPSRATTNQAASNGLTNKSTSSCPPAFSNHTHKSKDPPQYEEAVKQTRSMQTAAKVPTATSQHMDDLFDVLIESGEISPFIRLDPPFPDKLLPVTACVTTLPINTVLSRPPPQIQVARQPAPTLGPQVPLSMTAALATDNQLEAFLEDTLRGASEPRTLRQMEELHGRLLEHSPMDMDPDATSFNLENTSLENMEWLDLTMPGPAGGLNPLGLPPSTGVFSSDFLDSHDLQLNWD